MPTPLNAERKSKIKREKKNSTAKRSTLIERITNTLANPETTMTMIMAKSLTKLAQESSRRSLPS